MNPYLRIKQRIRPTAYLYAQHYLEGEWPEMEPESSTKPTLRVEILGESPIGKSDIYNEYNVEATIGIFFDDELFTKLLAQKWLRVRRDQVLEYGSFNRALHLMGNPRIEPRTRDVYPWLELAPGLQDALDDVYEKWYPKPPTSLAAIKPALLEAFGSPLRSAPIGILIACEPTPRKLKFGDAVRLTETPNHTGIVIPAPEEEDAETFYGLEENTIYVQWDADGTQSWAIAADLTFVSPTIFITFAIWRDGDILSGRDVPIFAVAKTSTPTQLYFTAQSAVQAAYEACLQTPSDIVVSKKVEELSALVRDTLSKLPEER